MDYLLIIAVSLIAMAIGFAVGVIYSAEEMRAEQAAHHADLEKFRSQAFSLNEKIKVLVRDLELLQQRADRIESTKRRMP